MQEIIDNHEDLNHIYDCLDVITTDYSDVLAKRYAELFNHLYNKAPRTLYALFGHHATRLYYILNEEERRNVFEHFYFSKAMTPQEYTYFPDNELDTLHNKRWYIVLRGLWKPEYERKFRDAILPSVHEKLRYANTIMAITRGIFIRQKGGVGHLINKEDPFLKVFTYHNSRV